MNSKILLGAAGIALLAAAGTAQAEDPLPIVAGATLPMVTGEDPKISIEISDTVGVHWHFGDPILIENRLRFDVDIEWASGWNFAIDGSKYTSLEFTPQMYVYGDAYGHLSRTLGDFEVGVWFGGGFNCSIPGGCGAGGGFGGFVEYEYETDRLHIWSEIEARFFPGFDLNFMTEVEFDVNEQLQIGAYLDVYSFTDWSVEFWSDFEVNDRLDIGAWIEFDDDGFDEVGVWADFDVNDKLFLAFEFDFDAVDDWDLEFWGDFDVTDMLEIGAWIDFDEDGFDGAGVWAELDLGNIEPYAGIWFDGPGDFGMEIGADLDDQIGTGPYSLIGNVELEVGGCCGPAFNARIGIKYEIGGDGDDDDH